MSEPAPAIVRLAEFAKLHAVSKAAVTKWKARGLLVLTPEGRVDVLASNAKLAERPAVNRGQLTKGPVNRDASAQLGERDTPSEIWTTAEAARRERIAVAKLRELELAEKAGKVVAAAAVENEWAGFLGSARARLLAVPARCGARIPHLTPLEIAVITTEIRDAMSELGGGSGNR